MNGSRIATITGCRRSRNGSSTAGTPPISVAGQRFGERIAGVEDQFAARDRLDEADRDRPRR